MAVIYKTLFEIKLLHEYYLTAKDGATIFENSSQAQRLNFLQDEFNVGHPSINEDVGYEFPETLKKVYENYHLKLVPSYSGCKVVARVNAFQQADNSVLFKPFASFPSSFPVFISLIRKNNNLDSYTNQRIKRPVPATYFFSTQTVATPRSFPFLTNAVPAENNSAEYEQGELAFSSLNSIREFFRSQGNDQWNDVNGSGFANESDRLLVNPRFEYNFGNQALMTEAEFVLRDSNSVEVERIILNQPNGIASRHSLDFSGKIKPVSHSGPFVPLTSLYTLEARANNGYSAFHTVLFSDELLKEKPWAMIHVDTAATNDFSLFAPDGFLIRRRSALGLMTPAPVFEIPFKSRFAFWRFINDRGKELGLVPALSDYLQKDGNVLITKQPRSIARHWFLLEKDGPPGTVYVPNPVSFDARLEQDRRLYFDVIVPQSALFPVIT